MGEGFDDGEVCVVEFDVFADEGDVDGLISGKDAGNHGFPVFHVARAVVKAEFFEGDAVEAMNQTMQELQASVLSAARTDSMNLDTEMSIDTAESDGSEEETLPQEADAAQPVYSMALTIDGDDAITYLDDHYVCVRADGYEYTGGAHGTPFRQYFVFDRETGARLSLSDVVENPVEELQAKVGAAFRELAEKTNFAFESPEDLEHTVADGISYESPFYLSETGVVFYYAPYEIASYAEGFPEVTIPYSELEMRIELSK